MPEGHVIHRLARDINAHFRGRTVTVTSPQGRFAAEAGVVDHAVVEGAEAYGKHLFIHFAAPAPEHIIYVHLGLIGQLSFEDTAETKGQIRLHIASDATAANLRGPQYCRLITEKEYNRYKEKVGQDPLRADADPHALWEKVHASRRSIGSLLMDQKLFAGVGNIYRAEVLFRQRISPFRPGKEVSHTEFSKIWADLVELMGYGVDHGRIDTVAPAHTPNAMGRAPRKDDHGGEVYVYRREGQPCYVCGTPIAARVMEGRNLFWCPSCQQD